MLIFIGFGKLTSNIVTMILSVNLVIFYSGFTSSFVRNYDDGTMLRFVLLASFCSVSFEIFSLSAFSDSHTFFKGNCYLLHRIRNWVCA
ncbi:hypothetical protein SLA2020_277730 [Shorea laevis]